jgi:peptide/nickel transport system substrate-binding protein
MRIRPPQLILAQISDPTTFNSYLSTDNASSTALNFTLAGLTRLNPDTLQPEPDLAAKWESFDDGLRYLFTLRSGLQWSDGHPLTAKDVEFTFNDIIFNESIPTSSRDVQRIGEKGLLPKVTLINEKTIQFELPEPFAPFLIQVGTPIMPEHILKSMIDTLDSKGNPLFLKTWGVETAIQHPEELVSNGPYQIIEYTPNQRIVYRANPYYQGSRSRDKLPRIQKLILRIVDAQDTALLQFRSGELDHYTVRGSDFQLLKKEEKREKFTIYNLGPTLNNNFICFNQSLARDPNNNTPFVDPIKSRWFRDLAFRRAINYAIDKQGLVNSILRGLGEPQQYTISPASPFHLKTEAHLYDPEKARQILLQAGYDYDKNQRLQDLQGNIIRFTLNTNAGNNEREAAGSLIKSYLDQIGITVDFVPIDFSTLVEKISSTREWEAVMLSFGGGGVEPNNGANIWRTTGRLHIWNLGSQLNNPVVGVEFSDWEKEIDQIFSAGTREQSFARRKELYDRFQRIVQEQLPLIGTYNPLTIEALRDRIQGWDPRPILGSLWNLEELVIVP